MPLIIPHVFCNFLVLFYMIICFSAETRLVGGSSYSEGRVVVFYNRAWGTVCDDDWDMTDAQVACHSMGYGDARSTRSYGQGSGNIVFDNLRCSGSESSLYACTHNGYGVHNCDHSDDAGVSCTGKTL